MFSTSYFVILQPSYKVSFNVVYRPVPKIYTWVRWHSLHFLKRVNVKIGKEEDGETPLWQECCFTIKLTVFSYSVGTFCESFAHCLKIFPQWKWAVLFYGYFEHFFKLLKISKWSVSKNITCILKQALHLEKK